MAQQINDSEHDREKIKWPPAREPIAMYTLFRLTLWPGGGNPFVFKFNTLGASFIMWSGIRDAGGGSTGLSLNVIAIGFSKAGLGEAVGELTASPQKNGLTFTK